MTIEEIVDYLSKYDGRELKLMEVCGSHTAAIAKSGIRDLLSPKISLIGGPGCPVCVTPSAYIDRLIELARLPDTTVVTFGDLLRVPGSVGSLNKAKSQGASVEMVYSPMDTLKLAKNNPKMQYVFAAVGFETTAPVYTILIEEAKKLKLTNIKLLTALKTMPPVIEWLMDNGAGIDGFIAPGHVAAVTGSEYFRDLSEKYNIPFAVTGFEDEELLIGLYGLVRMAEKKEGTVNNYYTSVVTLEGNLKAVNNLNTFYEKCDATWRGMGIVKNSGLKLSSKYSSWDIGSEQILEDKKVNKACCCGQILMGRLKPEDCPLFGKMCTPSNPQGACMVSFEGGCHQHYLNR